MTGIFIIFVIFCFITAKYKNPFNMDIYENFLDYNETKMINGIFVFLVFMTHFSGYVNSFFRVDSIYLGFNRFLGECVVSTFLFYSGYGMMEQTKKGKEKYLNKLLTKRFPTLLLKFSICVLLYIVLSYIMKKTLSVKQILLSLIGLDSVGNSAWYIFYMLFMYLAIYLSFRFINNEKFGLIILFGITILYTVILYYTKHDEPAYYLVAFVLPVGVMFSLFKEKITNFIKEHYVVSVLLSIFLYITSFAIRHILNLGGWAYSFTAIFFMSIILVATLKIKFNNVIIKFLGNHVFEIYIIQRLPMIALNSFYNSLDKIDPYNYLIYFSCSLLITVLLSICLKWIFSKMKI